MQTARDIAEQRFAKGEISEDEFISIISRLSQNQAKEPMLHNSKGDDANQDSSSQHAAAVAGYEEPVEAGLGAAQTSPKMEKHYRNSSVRADINIPLKFVEYSSKTVMVLYFIVFFLLWKNRDDLSFVNLILAAFGSETSDRTDALILAMVPIMAELVLLVSGLIWIYRATKNLFFFRISGLKYSPFASVGWFFVPIACLWLPLRAVHQIHSASRYGDSWVKTNLDSGVLGWWVLFWITTFFQMALPSEVTSTSEVTGIVVVYGIYCGISILSVFLFRELVKEATQAQESLMSE